jgi:hypothetical protein
MMCYLSSIETITSLNIVDVDALVWVEVGTGVAQGRGLQQTR